MAYDPFARWRDRYVQTFADGMDARIGVNCFAAARALALLAMGGYAANAAHHAIGDRDGFALGTDLLGLLVCTYNMTSFGMVQGTPASGPGPVVDPRARALTPVFVVTFAMSCLGSGNSVLFSVFGHQAPVPASWNLVAAVAQVVLAFSYLLRSCVWNRLPPPRRASTLSEGVAG